MPVAVMWSIKVLRVSVVKTTELTPDRGESLICAERS